MRAEYEVPAANVEGLRIRVAELNKRARRLGVPEVVMLEGAAFVKEVRVEVGGGRFKKVKRTYYAVSIVGNDVVESGWKFLATLHHEGEGETLVCTVPGETVPVAYRWSNSACDHCMVNRRRNSTYIIVSEKDGTIRQVGRSCLGDFLERPSRDPHNIARWAEIMGSFSLEVAGCEEEDWGGPRREPSWDLRMFLAATIAVMRKKGWTSRGMVKERGEGVATSDWVLNYLSDSTANDIRKLQAEVGPVTKEDDKKAERIVEWGESALVPETRTLSDYEHNLGIVARLGVVRLRHVGIAASMVRAWQRATQEGPVNMPGGPRTMKDERGKGPGRVEGAEWFPGAPGERCEAEGVRVTMAREMEDRGFGASCLVKMVTKDGILLTWFASSSAEWPEVGDVLSIRFTVKDHDQYQGRKETKVQRVKITEKAKVVKNER